LACYGALIYNISNRIIPVWKPADNLRWQKDALCADPSKKESMTWFYSKDPVEKNKAKNMCFSCPVRKNCLQWALEHREIWGIWGGKDEIELRRALSVAYNGEETKRNRPPNCPYCTARPGKLNTSIETLPPGGRWTRAKVVTCTECGFAWRGRSSANAVEAYKAEKEVKKKEKKKF
jgi:WhiB family redox-sensing transcriptional regulator